MAHAQQTPVISCQSDSAIFNTGINGKSWGNGSKPLGQPDNNWEVYFADSMTVVDPASIPENNWLLATVDRPAQGNGAWKTEDDAQWIGALTLGAMNSLVYYRYRFKLDSSVDHTRFELGLRLWVDNSLNKVLLNGKEVSGAGGGVYNSTGKSINMASANFVAGDNEIVVVSTDRGRPHGLMIKAERQKAICPAILNLEKTATTPLPQTIASGAQAAFNLVVSNTGSTAVADITLADTLPAELKNITWESCAASGAGAVCPALPKTPATSISGFTLPAGGKLTFNVTATADNVAAPVTVTNSATLSSTQADVSCHGSTITAAVGCTKTADVSLVPAPPLPQPIAGNIQSVPANAPWAWVMGMLAMLGLARRYYKRGY